MLRNRANFLESLCVSFPASLYTRVVRLEAQVKLLAVFPFQVKDEFFITRRAALKHEPGLQIADMHCTVPFP